MNEASETSDLHVARCSCGGLSVTVVGAPVRINACSCNDCQRRSGSAFTYTAFYLDAAVRGISGVYRLWREIRDAGRWHDTGFCPTCGVAVFCRLEAIPDTIGIAVGTLNDPGFAAPENFYWITRRHHWLPLPEGIGRLERQ
ncbi:MAG: GFA family protein [Devosia sp.]|nr:GFA family protein [Devosia sp.]